MNIWKQLHAAALVCCIALMSFGATADAETANSAGFLSKVRALSAPVTEPATCSLAYNLPGDIGPDSPFPGAQADLDEYSWQTFLALNAPGVGKQVNRKGDNATQWSQWSSTDALVECARDPDSPSCLCPDGDCTASGTKWYPEECMAIEGHQNYRVLAEVSKVDDLFLQATHGALSNDPLIDANGNFLRFEILVSPVAQRYVVDNQYYDADVLDGLTKGLKFPCGKAAYTGGNPNNSKSGSYIVKNAWMELPDDFLSIGYADRNMFHAEELLVYNPAYTNKSGVATCEKRIMGLVGQHIAHKTVKQPRWTWSTFEHARNAPSCTELPPPGDQDDAGPSLACPASVDESYNFYAESCSADGSDPDACQTCNIVPVSNRRGCKNPDVKGDTSWCLDKPPASVDGMTRACRQVDPEEYYPTAYKMSQACAAELGNKSVWSKYELISTQWYYDFAKRCTAKTNVSRGLERPQVPIPGRGGHETTPFLANSSMESYVRANCMGCHSHPTVGENSVSTDFMYWILLEVYDTGDTDALKDFVANSPH